MQIVIPEQRRVKWYNSQIIKGSQTDDGKEIFTTLGYFTSDKPDQVGDVITREATEEAAPRWKRWGNMRFQHNPDRPVGKALRVGSSDGLEWNQLLAKCVADDVINLIKEDVVTAQSIGAIIEDAEPVDPDQADNPFWFFFCGMKVLRMTLVEVSWTDHPCQYDAVLTGHSGNVVAVQNGLNLSFKSFDNRLLENIALDTTPSLMLSRQSFKSIDHASKWLDDTGYDAKHLAEAKSHFYLKAFDVEPENPLPYVTKQLGSGVYSVFRPLANKMFAGVTVEIDIPKSQDSPATPTSAENTNQEKVSMEEQAVPAAPETLPEEKPEVVEEKTLPADPVAPPAEEKKEIPPEVKVEPVEEKKEEANPLLDAVAQLTKAVNDLAAKQVDTEALAKSLAEKLTPKPAEPEAPKEVVEDKSSEDNLEVTRALGGLSEQIKALEAKQASLEDSLFARCKEYIDTLRNTPQPAKGALLPNDEEKKETPKTPADVRKALRDTIHKAIDKE